MQSRLLCALITKGVFFKVTHTIWIMYFGGEPTYSHANTGENARPYSRPFFLYYIMLYYNILYWYLLYFIFLLRYITIYYIILRYIILRFFALSYIALYYFTLLRPARIPTVRGVYSIQRIPRPGNSHSARYCARWAPTIIGRCPPHA